MFMVLRSCTRHPRLTDAAATGPTSPLMSFIVTALSRRADSLASRMTVAPFLGNTLAIDMVARLAAGLRTKQTTGACPFPILLSSSGRSPRRRRTSTARCRLAFTTSCLVFGSTRTRRWMRCRWCGKEWTTSGHHGPKEAQPLVVLTHGRCEQADASGPPCARTFSPRSATSSSAGNLAKFDFEASAGLAKRKAARAREAFLDIQWLFHSG
ncbi:hypothetical protein BKA62DRAFT_724077 [Auriculariales sp. MPI-PUGE-AT-0066]|nr:hypothetical protein BKA62DRAFT_724077 [Auriculariales sp. MPI-PUGE-AT-0066]